MTIEFNTARMRLDAAAQGLTAGALGKRAKCTPMQVSRFLRGQSRSPVIAKKLAKALGYSVRRYLPSEDVVARSEAVSA